MKSLTDRTLNIFAVVVSGCVVGAAAYLYVSAGARWPYLLAMGVMCIAWIARVVSANRSEQNPGSRSTERQITAGIAWSGVFLIVALSTKLGAHMGWPAFHSDMVVRILGIAMGALVVALANSIPKKIVSARALATLRLAGWALVLGGAGSALAWWALPLRYADTVAMALLMAGVLITAVLLVGWRRSNEPCRPDHVTPPT